MIWGLIAGLWISEARAASVRPSALAGTWYPATPSKLAKKVDILLAEAPTSLIHGRLAALIVPHAAYAYSGPIAARAYKTLQGKRFGRVIIIAPSHYSWFKGISIPQVFSYRTPLGLVQVDTKASRGLLAKAPFKTVSEAHRREHAIEIHLPFLQRILKDWKLIPMLVGNLEEEDFESASKEIKKIAGASAETLVIASSDFTHFGPRFNYVPFKKDVAENLKMLDHGAIGRILKRDFRGFMDYVRDTGITICGFRPIGILLKTLPPEVAARLLGYDTSGRIIGDYRNSVSYVSIAFSIE